MAQLSVNRPDIVPDARATAAGSRGRAGLEFGLLIGGVLAIMWVVPFTPAPRVVRAAIVGFLVALLVVCELRDRPGSRALGFRLDNLLPVLRRLAPYVVGLIAVLVTFGAWAGTLRFEARFWSMLAGVPAWALLQQYLLLGFAHRRLRVLLGAGRRSVFATTALFGLMHLPNPMLSVVCALGGFVWARAYDHSPNLFAHAITHTIGSAFLANSLPRALLKSMKVGYGYLAS